MHSVFGKREFRFLLENGIACYKQTLKVRVGGLCGAIHAGLRLLILPYWTSLTKCPRGSLQRTLGSLLSPKGQGAKLTTPMGLSKTGFRATIGPSRPSGLVTFLFRHRVSAASLLNCAILFPSAGRRCGTVCALTFVDHLRFPREISWALEKNPFINTKRRIK